MRKGFLKKLIKNEGGETMKNEGGETMKRLNLIIGLLIIVLLVPVLSEAIPITINNPGFEADILADGGIKYPPISGWSTSSSSEAGVWNPLEKYMGTLYFTGGIPEGKNVAYSKGPSIYQILSYTLTPNTQLTLSVDIGWRLDMPLPAYEVQLWAGSNLLASESSATLMKGQFVTSILSYNVTALNPYLGQQVQQVMIMLNKTGGRQVNFDNVRLENHPGPSVVPEPSTLLLLGFGLVGFGYYIRRRKG